MRATAGRSLSREARLSPASALQLAVATFLLVASAGTPALASPAPVAAPVDVTMGNVTALVDAELATEVDGAWYVDGAAVAAAAAGLRTVNSSQVGYDRDLFSDWSDLDGNGCDARNDILQRDLTSVVLRDGDDCVVERGMLTDPYTDEVIPFTRGVETSGAVHIDHIVPLAAAWTGGANEWSPERREAFANDPRNLQAVDGRANSAKGMRLPSEWMPLNTAFHCTYLAQITNVLTAYDLAVTPLDQDAIINGGRINGIAFAGASACGLPASAQADPSRTASACQSPSTGASGRQASASADPADAARAGDDDPVDATGARSTAAFWLIGLTGAAVLLLSAGHIRGRRRRAQ